MMRDTVINGAGALAEGARQGVRSAVARYKRDRGWSRTRRVVTTVGVAAAIAGVVYGTVAAFRAVRDS